MHGWPDHQHSASLDRPGGADSPWDDMEQSALHGFPGWHNAVRTATLTILTALCHPGKPCNADCSMSSLEISSPWPTQGGGVLVVRPAVHPHGIQP